MTRLFLVLTVLCALFQPLQAYATAAVATGAATAEETAAEPAPPPIDSIGRSSPRGLVEGFLNAIGNENFEKAAQYLDMGAISDRQKSIKGPKLAQDLQTLLDRGGWLSPSAMLSSAREGEMDGDDPETDMTDIIGGIQTATGTIDILGERVTNKDGNQIWLISKATLDQIPSLLTVSAKTDPVINSILPDYLLQHKWGGAPAGHWIAVAFLLVISYSMAWFLMTGLLALIKKVWKKRCNVSGVHILDTLRLPLSLYSAVWIFGLSAFFLDISVLVRHHVTQLNVIVAWLAIAIFLWRLIDVFTETAQRRIGSTARFYGFSSILYFFRRLIKIAFGVLVLFIILDNMGVDVTAGLAALGIGGIALALGAQKTLENFIGSLAIVIDQPVHIGDYCKIGGVAGTVEDIGMRSTRLRTNDRTLVTIPNGDLSN
ncbi:MAG: mechanosensitive ion channel protein MscS, partial [Micavibrio aeruginosavorus]